MVKKSTNTLKIKKEVKPKKKKVTNKDEKDFFSELLVGPKEIKDYQNQLKKQEAREKRQKKLQQKKGAAQDKEIDLEALTLEAVRNKVHLLDDNFHLSNPEDFHRSNWDSPPWWSIEDFSDSTIKKIQEKEEVRLYAEIQGFPLLDDDDEKKVKSYFQKYIELVAKLTPAERARLLGDGEDNPSVKSEPEPEVPLPPQEQPDPQLLKPKKKRIRRKKLEEDEREKDDSVFE